MINVAEKEEVKNYRWEDLCAGDIVKPSVWKDPKDYGLVVRRTADSVLVFRFYLGTTHEIKKSDTAGWSFAKYDADLIITRRV